VWADWRKVIAGEQSVAAFFSNRTIVQKCRQLLARLGPSRVRHGNSAERDHATLETYDQWLLGYLQGITAKYEPRRFPVRIALLRSREEPTGWFFRPDAGWASVTTEPIELAFVDGDHFTMFKSPGVEEMGRCIARSIDRTVARTAGAAANPGS